MIRQREAELPFSRVREEARPRRRMRTISEQSGFINAGETGFKIPLASRKDEPRQG